MNVKWMCLATVFLLTAVALAGPPLADTDQQWPQWRGPNATGAAGTGSPPVEWGEDQNIRWKVAIPGKGSSSPVLWGNRIYLTTAVPTGNKIEAPPQPEPEPSPQGDQPAGRRGRRGFHRNRTPPTEYLRFVVLAIDRQTGEIAWEKTVEEVVPHEGIHQTGSFAGGSAVTDGEHIYAFFGSRGLYCLDTEGNVKWKKAFGKMTIKVSFGEGASPVLHNQAIVIPWDHEGESFIVALNKETGEELWRAERDEITSWATPLVVEHEGVAQVVTSATRKVRTYDLSDGKLLWELTGMTNNTIPSPVSEDGIVYLTSGFRGNALMAVRLAQARGDITGSEAILWSLDRDTPYVPSPLLYGGIIYLLKGNTGILSAFDATTGERHYQQRLEGLGNIYASPVGAGGRVYVTDRAGKTVVVKAGSEPEVLATNSLEDGFDASMAAVGDEIYLRGSSLYRISTE